MTGTFGFCRSIARGPASIAIWACLGLAVSEPVAQIELGARRGEARGVEYLEVAVPGVLTDFAAPLGVDGTRPDVWLLARAPERSSARVERRGGTGVPHRPRCVRDGGTLFRLYRVAVDGAPRLVEELEFERSEARLESADVDGDGAQELLLVSDGELRPVERHPATNRVSIGEAAYRHEGLADPTFGGYWLDDGSRAGRDAPVRVSFGFGVMQLWWPRSGRVVDVDLPVRVSAGGRSFDASTEQPRFVGAGADGTRWFVSHPKVRGDVRVEVARWSIDLEGGVEHAECWVRLPKAESVQGWRALLLDGRPYVVLSTVPADKLSFFGELRLRLAELEPDRSRLGREPLLAVETGASRFVEANPWLQDADGDGRDDLLIGYREGRRSKRIVVDVFRRKEDGGFDERERRSVPDTEELDFGWIGTGGDVDGDGRSDLLLRGDAGIVLHAGRSETRGGRVVFEPEGRPIVPAGVAASSSFTTVVVGSDGTSARRTVGGARAPTTMDFDGDGADEVVVWLEGDVDRPGTLRVSWIARP